MRFKGFLITACLFFIIQMVYSQETIKFVGEKFLIGKHVQVLTDSSGSMTLDDVLSSTNFKPSSSEVLDFQVSPYTYWIRFQVFNTSASDDVRVQIQYPIIDSLLFYQILGDSVFRKNETGSKFKFNTREIKEHQFFIYPLSIPKNDTLTCYLRVKSGTQLMLPIYIGTRDQLLGNLLTKDLLFGIYLGIILVMIFYNGFVYFSLRDIHYLLYIVYLITVGFTQASLEGYTFRFLFADHPEIASFNIYLSSALIGITAIEFAKKFLNSKKYAPFLHKVSYCFLAVYIVAALLPFFGQFNISYQIILASAAFSSIYVLTMAWIVKKNGSRSAKYFLIAWSIFVASVLVFVLKDFGYLPYNNFTSSALQIGSAIEAIMLSFALADRINQYREQKEAYQKKSYLVIKENERIIKEQNVLLEEQVTIRTNQLVKTNSELENALMELKNAEAQLVESEKMASLGLLTAGIAHEINNPINFVTSNVTPLRRDISILQNLLADIEGVMLEPLTENEKLSKIEILKNQADYDYLKVEIDFLLKGIHEGATRTSEIVKGLRVFSRLDEDDIKLANLNDGMESTISILNHLLNGKISVEKIYGDIPLVECYPGKLNQLFLNILNNAIQAIHERWGESHEGKIVISTYEKAENVYIRILDNGIGMSPETQKQLFEPFFTTKDVGKGTGLGLSIVWNTINKHQGNIEVNSELGVGTEFILSIPIHHQSNLNDQ